MPKFSGWLQNSYLREKCITVSQDDRGLAGKSSWSDLFSRLDIDPVDLRTLGDVKPLPPPPRKGGELVNTLGIRTRRPGLADVLVENGSISYGFSAAEFAALTILCGFRPEDLAAKPTSHSTSYFGQMQVAENGQLSQIAKFDSHHGFRDSYGTYKTDMRDIPVAHCLNLAFGMIRTKGRSGREWIVLPESAPQDSLMRMWSGYPQSKQLKKIQYAFESFAGAGELYIADYAHQRDDLDEHDVDTMHSLLCVDDLRFTEKLDVSRTGVPYPPAMKARETLNAAHVIAAIQPWALLPILPRHVVSALRVVLDPFFKTKEHTVLVLQRELLSVLDKRYRPEGRTGRELSQRLSHAIVGAKDHFSDSHSAGTAMYHEAMCLVFRHNNIRFDDVRISLAAAVATNLFQSGEGTHSGQQRLRLSMTKYLARCYSLSKSGDVSRNIPEWAIDVYTGYLWGWITDSIPAHLDLISLFKRRVFLS